jgi:hypothetical protein
MCQRLVAKGFSRKETLAALTTAECVATRDIPTRVALVYRLLLFGAKICADGADSADGANC